MTGDRNFMYLASLFDEKEILNVYTVHAITARRLKGHKYYSRRDEEDDFWMSLCECDDDFLKSYHSVTVFCL